MGMGVIKISELMQAAGLTGATFYVIDANGRSCKCSAEALLDYISQNFYTQSIADNLFQKRVVTRPPIMVGTEGWLLTNSVTDFNLYTLRDPLTMADGETYEVFAEYGDEYFSIKGLWSAVKTTVDGVVTLTPLDSDEEPMPLLASTYPESQDPVTIENFINLKFDPYPVEDSENLLTSGEIYYQIQRLKEYNTGYVQSGSSVPGGGQPVTANGVYVALTTGYVGAPGNISAAFESTPTQNSAKAIQSGAVWNIAQRIPEAPDANGIYTLKCQVSGGTKTYTWVAD